MCRATVMRSVMLTFVLVDVCQSVIFIQTTSRFDRGDDIIFSGVDSNCPPEGGVDCSNAGVTPTDALIRPSSRGGPTPAALVPSTTPRMPQTTFEPVVPLEETSGEEPCDDDDIDCNDQSSGSDKLPERPVNKPQPTDDSIYFDTHTLTEKVPCRNHTGTGDQEWSSDDKTSTRRPRTTPEPLVIRENMTVAPPRKPLHRITTRAPVGQQTTPSKGGGHGYVTEVDPEPKRSSPQDRLKMNIGLIAGIAAGVILLLLLLAFALYKYKSRDEGTYKVDEGKNYGYEVCASGTAGSNSDTNGTTKCGGGMTPPSGKRKKKDVKEWYV